MNDFKFYHIEVCEVITPFDETRYRITAMHIKNDVYLDYYWDDYVKFRYILVKGVVSTELERKPSGLTLKHYKKAYDLYKNDQFNKIIEEIVNE